MEEILHILFLIWIKVEVGRQDMHGWGAVE